MLETLSAFRAVSTRMDASLSRISERPDVAREKAYYLSEIEKITSIDDFMANDRVFRFAMEAFGLGDMSYAKGFMRKMLEEGLDSSSSLANKLSDSRYKAFVETFNFARYGETTTVFESTRQGTADRYVRQALETQSGEQNQGVQLALYFERKAATLTDPYDILADKALIEVVRVGLSLPENLSALPLDRQADMILKKMDIEDFQDPEKVQKFLETFTMKWDIENGTNLSASSPALQILSSGASVGLSMDLVISLQSLKFAR